MRTNRPIIVVASVLALALAAGLVLAASARATFPGRNRLIAFSARVAGTEQIFVMNPDGSGQKQITHISGNHGAYMPSISPDGRRIVFVQWTGASTVEIRAMSTTGANPRHLATSWCQGLSFSPNGRQVVFAVNKQVWVMNADGSHQRHLIALGGHINVMAHSPTYSPDGKTIAFVAQIVVSQSSPKNRFEILAINADGTHLRRLAYTSEPNHVTPPTLGVSFSPDGKRIVYDAWVTKSETILRVMNADGTNQRLLPRSYGFTQPCYSPDGRQILCVNGHSQISAASANGTHWRRLTSVSGGTDNPNWGPHAR